MPGKQTNRVSFEGSSLDDLGRRNGRSGGKDPTVPGGAKKRIISKSVSELTNRTGASGRVDVETPKKTGRVIASNLQKKWPFYLKEIDNKEENNIENPEIPNKESGQRVERLGYGLSEELLLQLEKLKGRPLQADKVEKLLSMVFAEVGMQRLSPGLESLASRMSLKAEMDSAIQYAPDAELFLPEETQDIRFALKGLPKWKYRKVLSDDEGDLRPYILEKLNGRLLKELEVREFFEIVWGPYRDGGVLFLDQISSNRGKAGFDPLLVQTLRNKGVKREDGILPPTVADRTDTVLNDPSTGVDDGFRAHHAYRTRKYDKGRNRLIAPQA